jgi:hypothetical protein
MSLIPRTTLHSDSEHLQFIRERKDDIKRCALLKK